MELIADALLIAGAVGAALYCRTLARKLGALRDMDSGLGAAIAALSRQVDEMRVSLDAAKSISGDQNREVTQLVARAEMAAGRLELLLASLHEGERRRPIGTAAERRQSSTPRSALRPVETERPRVNEPASLSEPRDQRGSSDTTHDEAAAIEAVLRGLAGKDVVTAEPGGEGKPGRRPSIFDEAYDELDDTETAAGAPR